MQNQPSSGARFAKVYKYMFVAPPGWVFIGADFNALESRIDALKTKDPNKLLIYQAGLDSHSWNAFGYWGDQMPDIQRAPPDARCFKANVGGTDVYFHAEEQIEYLGQNMRGDELYELLTRQGL